MENENLKQEIKSNDIITNRFALENLLDFGRKNLLNDEFYNKQIENTENSYNSGVGIPIMTKDMALKIIKSSRQMATLESKDLFDLIQCEIYVTHEIEQENTSPDYDY